MTRHPQLRAPRLAGARVAIQASDAAVAAIALCGASVLLPAVPGYPGLTCPLRASTGVPCPLCGLTTSVRALLTIDPGASLALNPLGLAALVGAGAALLQRRRTLELPAAVMPAALALSWVYQLLRFSPL